ncbi:hypothetical protein [Euryhalocaulis caribicus]|uniref:hypothetical protein n=1 Tax=Euryhalocaulis caribicus TaxID=1161401 RepID=UPI001269549E|nr:hypothetical protein [Euryhalocaulis caribicus]
MKNPLREYDDTTLFAAGAAGALVLAALTADYAWVRTKPDETKRAYRKRAGKTTAIAFGLAGAFGAGLAIALFGPKAIGEKSWGGALHALEDSLSDTLDSLNDTAKSLRKKI